MLKPFAPRGVVTLVLDDGYQDVLDQVVPLLRRYGIHATFAVPVATEYAAQADGAALAALDVWKDVCLRDGHELAAHGVTHRPLTSLNDGELEQELMKSRETTNATTLVYPGGAHDDRVVRAAQTIFAVARTVRWGFEQPAPTDRYRLRSFVATQRNYRVWKWNLRAVWAWVTNKWLIETYHNVAATDGRRQPNNLHTIPLAEIERHLRFIRRLPLRIATIRDIVHP